MRPRDRVVEVAQDVIAGHPAALAWARLGLGPAAHSLQVMREKPKSSLYRLPGVAPGGSSVIAKRSRSAAAAIEREIYEDVLPSLPVTSPRYYGSIQESAGYSWLFIEDVGAERYSISNREYFALAGRWLGLMHTSAASDCGSRLQAALPDGGPGRYLTHLGAGRREILAHLENPALTGEDVRVLNALVSQQDRLEAAWSRVEDRCAGMPSTLVHGDFRPKNGYVRRGSGGLELFPIDWEMAGWGIPTADLTWVDLAAYESAVREDWPGLGASSLRRQAGVGHAFRLLAAISWESLSLKYETRLQVVKAATSMKVYLDQLSNAIEVAGLA